MRLETPTTRLLKRVQSWQKAIVSHLAASPGFEAASIDRTTQNLILVILVLYLSEQQKIVPQGILQQLIKSDRLLVRLVSLWQDWQTRFKVQINFDLSPQLALPDRLLQFMLQDLYAPDPKQFSSLSGAVLGQVYEAILGSAVPLASTPTAGKPHRCRPNQKANGIYYTPAPLVQFMVEQTIGELLPSLSDTSTFYVADPACGGGAFLLASYQFLLDHWRHHDASPFSENHSWRVQHQGQWQLTSLARRQILLNCIYGVDLDPQAIVVTKLALWLKLLEEIPDQSIEALPDLSQNLCLGNALIGTDYDASDALVCPFDWETAFPAVMRSGGFDVVIGNPPYLDSEWMMAHLPNWRRYCNRHYRTATGNWDLFCVFIEKALALCRSGGMLSFVVPNKLASADYAAQVRSLLLQETHLQTIRDYAQVPVFAAAVYPLVYVAKHSPAPSELQVRCEVMRDLEQVDRSGWLNFSTSDRAGDPANLSTRPWHLTISGQEATLLQRLSQELPVFGSVATIYGAATVAEAYDLQAWIQDCKMPAVEDWRFINSGTIDRYSILWGQKPTRYLGQVYAHPIIRAADQQQLPPRRQVQAKQPKIIVSGMSRWLKCTLDANGNLLAGKSTCIVLSAIDSKLDLHYLLGLLNSKLLSFYFFHRFAGNRLQGGYFRVGTEQLRQLPIAIPDLTNLEEQKSYEKVIDLVKERMTIAQPEKTSENTEQIEEIKEEIRKDKLDQEIDHLVFDFYRLTDEERTAIEQIQFKKKRKNS